MQSLKILPLLALCGVLGFCGCANPRHLIGGVARPPSEVVTVVLTESDLWNHAQIWENGHWEPLSNDSQVSPGRQDVVFALARDVGALGYPDVTYVKVSASFTASAGDIVTFYEAPHELKRVAKDDLVHYTIKNAAGTVVEGKGR